MEWTGRLGHNWSLLLQLKSIYPTSRGACVVTCLPHLQLCEAEADLPWAWSPALGLESCPGPALRTRARGWPVSSFSLLGGLSCVPAPAPDLTAFLILLVTATPFVFLAISALGLLPCSVLLRTTAQGQREELFKRIPAAASKPKFRSLPRHALERKPGQEE